MKVSITSRSMVRLLLTTKSLTSPNVAGTLSAAAATAAARAERAGGVTAPGEDVAGGRWAGDPDAPLALPLAGDGPGACGLADGDGLCGVRAGADAVAGVVPPDEA